MLALLIILALFAAIIFARLLQDHRNSGLHDGWYGHSDYSTDRTGSFLGPFA